jgi:hypothetical protein
VTPELSVAIQRLGKMRHRLAHTVAGEATDVEVRSLSDALASERELDGLNPDDYSPGDQLRLAISALWTAVDDAGAEAWAQRAEAQKALAAYRQHRDDRALEVGRLWKEMRGSGAARASGSGAALFEGDA